jgi:hypothetical protein
LTQFSKIGIITIDFRKRDTPESLWWCFPSKFIISDHADTVSRPTEDEAIVNIIEAARRIFRYRSDVFTTQMRHTEVIKLADYANRLAINPTAFTAGVLKYDRSWVRKVLVEAGWFDKKATENAEKFHSIYESSEHPKRRQPENRVKRIMASGTKPCPAHGENRFCKGHAYGCDSLCEECLKVYGVTRESWPDWLLFLVRDDEREARRKAQESVLHLELSDDIAA